MAIDVTPPSGRLPHLGALRFTGPDCLSFLQGQISNDTRRLEEGESLLAAYSSPQGRVLALMHLLPHSGGIIAIVPRELISPTLEAMRKFVLRAKVKIEDACDLAVAGVQGRHRLESAGIAAPLSVTGYAENDGIGVAALNCDPDRYWIIGAAGKLAHRGVAGGSGEADQFDQAWRLANIRAGLPQIYLATRQAFVAQMLNLDRLNAISFTKGCYTGQEIIARTQHLGRIKRRLYRLQLPDGEWVIGQPLRLMDGRSGRVVEVIRNSSGFEALAVLNVLASGESSYGDEASGAAVAAEALPLPYELL